MTTLETLYPYFAETLPNDPSKKKAWDTLVQMGLPTKKWEAFRYVPLQELYRPNWVVAQSAKTVPSHSALVFVDGHFKADLSRYPDTLIVLPLKQAYKSYGALLHKRFTESVQNDPDPFVLLNHALYQEGLFLYLAPNQKLQAPLEFVFIQTTPSSLACPKVDFFMGKGAQATTTTTYIQPGEGTSWTNGAFHLTLEEGAELSHFENSTGIKEGFGFQALRAHLKEKSRLQSFSLFTGTACYRQDLKVTLAGSGAEAELKGLQLLEQKGEAHTHIHMQHVAPQAKSYQHYKSVISDVARVSFSGKIYVEKEAQQTDAYQLSNSLLLGEKAKAMCQPNLEVFADDVKASHGATCARPNADELFYLRTRGLNTHDAQKQLVRGFCRELTETITYAPLKAELEKFLPKSFNLG